METSSHDDRPGTLDMIDFEVSLLQGTIEPIRPPSQLTGLEARQLECCSVAEATIINSLKKTGLIPSNEKLSLDSDNSYSSAIKEQLADDELFEAYQVLVLACGALVEEISTEGGPHYQGIDSETAADMICENLIPEFFAPLSSESREHLYTALLHFFQNLLQPDFDYKSASVLIKDEVNSAEASYLNELCLKSYISSDTNFVEKALDVYSGCHDGNHQLALQLVESILGLARTQSALDGGEISEGERRVYKIGMAQFKSKVSEITAKNPELEVFADLLLQEYTDELFSYKSQ